MRMEIPDTILLLTYFFTFLPQIFRVQIFANKEKFDNMLNNDNFTINILQAFEIKKNNRNDNSNNNNKK